jgi:hypothetical protein
VNGTLYPSFLNFCKTCKGAGVSAIGFSEISSHFKHQRLQIFKDMSGFKYVRVSDIEDIIHTNEVAVYAYEAEEVYYLRRRTLYPEERCLMTCRGCHTILPNAERDDLRRRNEDVTLCSIECLVEYNRAEHGDEDSNT